MYFYTFPSDNNDLILIDILVYNLTCNLKQKNITVTITIVKDV